MKDNNKDQSIVIPPIWPIITFLVLGGAWSGLMLLFGATPVRHGTSYPALCLFCWLAVFVFWKSYQFDAEGFTYTRCGIIRKRIRWIEVVQIVTVSLDSKRLPREVTLIILDSIGEYERYRTGRNAKEFIQQNKKHLYIVDYTNAIQKAELLHFLDQVTLQDDF